MNIDNTNEQDAINLIRKLCIWEIDSLRNYKNAIESAHINDDAKIRYVINELRISLEKLLRSICTVKYNIPENKKIRDIFQVLDSQKFWGVPAIGGFVHNNDKLFIIQKQVTVVNALGNLVKHAVYPVTYYESIQCLHSMHVIIEWYFKDLFNHESLDLREEERQLLNKIFQNTIIIPKEIEALLKIKDQQIATLNKKNTELNETISKLHTRRNSYGLLRNKISENENDKIATEEEIIQLKKTIELFPNDILYNRCGLLLFNLAILKDNEEKKIDEARKMFIKSFTLNQYNYEAYNNLGNVLNKQAEIFDTEILYFEAIDKYETAIKINESYFEAHYNCGNVYQKLSQNRNEPEKTTFLKIALDHYIKGEQLATDLKDKNYHSYNIACIYSILNDPDNAILFLTRAIQSGKYSFKKIANDPDFTNIKNHKSFINLRSSRK